MNTAYLAGYEAGYGDGLPFKEGILANPYDKDTESFCDWERGYKCGFTEWSAE